MGGLVSIGLPLALAFIMFSLGIGLEPGDFKRVVTQPRDFLVGALSQVILLPVVAAVLVILFPLEPAIAIGVMLIAAAPGGATSNILTAFAKGDVALSISLTAVMSLLCVITIPLIVVTAHDVLVPSAAVGDVSLAGTAIQVFAIVTVPVLLGMYFRRLANDTAMRFEPIARKISVVLFVLVLLGAILQERANIVPYFAKAGLVTLVLNVVMMALAWWLARAFATGPRQRSAIAIECGLQNGTIAITVGTLLFGGGLYIVPAATYSLIMFGTALIFIAIVRRTSSVNN